MPYVVPLLARAGVLLCEPPETVGKAAWAGLGRRLGWMLGASFVCIRTSEDSQPTGIYHDTDQYLIRLLPWSTVPAHAHCTIHASIAVHPSALEYFCMWSHCMSSRMFFSTLECGETRRIVGSINLDDSVPSSSILDRLVCNLLHCRDNRVSPGLPSVACRATPIEFAGNPRPCPVHPPRYE